MYGGNIPPIKISSQRKTFGKIIEAISPRANENEGARGCEVS
jgi:hypothetical protein